MKRNFTDIQSNKPIKKSEKQLKKAIPELYLLVKKLENYRELNYEGFRKICKKHDKMLHSTAGHKFYQQIVKVSEFHRNIQVISFYLKFKLLPTLGLSNSVSVGRTYD